MSLQRSEASMNKVSIIRTQSISSRCQAVPLEHDSEQNFRLTRNVKEACVRFSSTTVWQFRFVILLICRFALRWVTRTVKGRGPFDHFLLSVKVYLLPATTTYAGAASNLLYLVSTNITSKNNLQLIPTFKKVRRAQTETTWQHGNKSFAGAFCEVTWCCARNKCSYKQISRRVFQKLLAN